MRYFGLSLGFLIVAQLSTALFVPDSHGLVARQVSVPELFISCQIIDLI